MNKEDEKRREELLEMSTLQQLKDELHRYRAENEKLKSELHFYKQAIRNLPNPVFIKDENLRFKWFSERYETVFGVNGDDLLGKTVLDLEYLDPNDRVKFHAEDQKAIHILGEAHYDTSLIFSDGKPHETMYWSKGFESENDGERGLIGELVDVSRASNDRKSLEHNLAVLTSAKERMEQISMVDNLTGLSNRMILDNVVSRLIALHTRYGLPFSILLLDLDHFKAINDTFGHPYGDKVLKQFSLILKKNCRTEDVAIRYGGEEFLLILQMTKLEKASEIAERIRKLTQTQISLPDGSPVTVSIGAAEYRSREKFEDTFSRVDHAVYAAKQAGRNRVSIENPHY